MIQFPFSLFFVCENVKMSNISMKKSKTIHMKTML